MNFEADVIAVGNVSLVLPCNNDGTIFSKGKYYTIVAKMHKKVAEIQECVRGQ